MKQHITKEEKWILLSIPLLFLLGTLFHFLYDISGQNHFVGYFSAINESVWEHDKMVLLPPILFWVILYFAKGKEYGIQKDRWFFAALISVLTMLFTIPMIYYFYTQAFGVELLWVDILILLLANIAGMLVGLHVYRYGKYTNWQTSIMLLLFLVLLFAYFTYHPPHLPIFIPKA